MDHTYIIQEGSWNAVGEFIDENGSITKAKGTSITKHYSDKWIHDGSMTILLEPKIIFSNQYQIVPLAKGAITTTFTSQNPALGQLYESLTFLPTSIFSFYKSTCGIYQGIEHLIQINKIEYKCYGLLLQREKYFSSWTMQLNRTEEK